MDLVFDYTSLEANLNNKPGLPHDEAAIAVQYAEIHLYEKRNHTVGAGTGKRRN